MNEISRMITWQQGATRFNYRAAGIVIRDEHVLLNQMVGTDFWFLPGGRVELREAAAESLAREMVEELGVAIRVERLVWIAESFFGDEGSAYHELALYFVMAFEPDAALYGRRGPFRGIEDHLTFQWHPLDALDRLVVYPPFLPAGLRALPDHPTHILDGR